MGEDRIARSTVAVAIELTSGVNAGKNAEKIGKTLPLSKTLISSTPTMTYRLVTSLIQTFPLPV